MRSVRDLHHRATEIAGYAYVALRKGNLEEAREFARQALPYEAEAAALVADQLDNEPTRSVLHRSAASLAMQCGEWDEAERLISIGLSGKPPALIAEQLQDLRKQVRKLRREAENAPAPQAKQPA